MSACGPAWRVESQASPSPFTKQSAFTLAPLDLVGLRVGEKSEKGYLEGKDEEAVKQWEAGKSALGDEFAKRITAALGASGIAIKPKGKGDGFQILPAIRWLDPGFFAAAAASSSRVKLTLTITAPDGTLLDTIEIEHGTPASTAHETIESRLRADAGAIGDIAADYIKSRIAQP